MNPRLIYWADNQFMAMAPEFKPGPLVSWNELHQLDRASLRAGHGAMYLESTHNPATCTLSAGFAGPHGREGIGVWVPSTGYIVVAEWKRGRQDGFVARRGATGYSFIGIHSAGVNSAYGQEITGDSSSGEDLLRGLQHAFDGREQDLPNVELLDDGLIGRITYADSYIECHWWEHGFVGFTLASNMGKIQIPINAVRDGEIRVTSGNRTWELTPPDRMQQVDG